MKLIPNGLNHFSRARRDRSGLGLIFELVIIERFMLARIASGYLVERLLPNSLKERISHRIDPVRTLLANVKSPASHALKDGQPVALAVPPGRPVPDFQHNAMFFRGAAVRMKHLAARRISTGENHGNLRHQGQPLRADFVEASPQTPTG